jgi:hypothetical protein
MKKPLLALLLCLICFFDFNFVDCEAPSTLEKKASNLDAKWVYTSLLVLNFLYVGYKICYFISFS